MLGREEGGPRKVSPPLPSPLLPCWVCCCQTSCLLGLHVWGMPVAGAPWDPQGLQMVGIILLLCSSLKLLHALGIIDLARGGGTGTGVGMGLQWGGDVVVEVLLTSCLRGCRVLGGGLEGLVCFGAFEGTLGCGRVSGNIRV